MRNLIILKRSALIIDHLIIDNLIIDTVENVIKFTRDNRKIT